MRQAMKRMKNRMERRRGLVTLEQLAAAAAFCAKRGFQAGGGKGKEEEVGEGVTNDVIEAEGEALSLTLSPSRRGSRIIESYDCGRESRDPVGRFVRTAAIFSPRKLAKAKVCG